jgi:hypothetical protein
MKRNSFLKFSLAAVASLTAPFVVMAKKIKDKRGDKVIKVVSGDDRFGKPISLFNGDTFYTKVSTIDTNGDVYVFESTRVKKAARISFTLRTG